MTGIHSNRRAKHTIIAPTRSQLCTLASDPKAHAKCCEMKTTSPTMKATAAAQRCSTARGNLLKAESTSNFHSAGASQMPLTKTNAAMAMAKYNHTTCLRNLAITSMRSSKWLCVMASGTCVQPFRLSSFLRLFEPGHADQEKWSTGRTFAEPSELHAHTCEKTRRTPRETSHTPTEPPARQRTLGARECPSNRIHWLYGKQGAT